MIGIAVAAEAGGAFPPFDASTFASQLFWLAIFFGGLYWLMARVALPQVEGLIADRKARIDGDLADAANAKAKAEAAMASYEKSLANARAEAQKIAQGERDRINAATDSRRKALEAELAGKLAAAEKAVAETKTKALANVEGIATDAAAAIVERLIGRPVSAADAARAVQSALKT
jgi:F-type H+-transporting ATPase subunit b